VFLLTAVLTSRLSSVLKFILSPSSNGEDPEGRGRTLGVGLDQLDSVGAVLSMDECCTMLGLPVLLAEGRADEGLAGGSISSLGAVRIDGEHLSMLAETFRMAVLTSHFSSLLRQVLSPSGDDKGPEEYITRGKGSDSAEAVSRAGESFCSFVILQMTEGLGRFSFLLGTVSSASGNGEDPIDSVAGQRGMDWNSTEAVLSVSEHCLTLSSLSLLTTFLRSCCCGTIFLER
jgi:hypothetical protein